MKLAMTLAFSLFCILPANADMVCPPNIVFADEVAIQTGPKKEVTLALNGVGLRKVFIVKVFFGGLYLEDLSSDADEIIQSDQAKVFTIHALRKIKREQLVEEWNGHFDRLCGDQCEELRPFHEQFISYTRDAQKGERLSTVFLKDRVDFITEDGSDFAPIESRAYGDLLLKSIIGPKPANVEFKKSVLGTGKKVCRDS